MSRTRKSHPSKLTPAQIERFRSYQEKWSDICRSPQPANQDLVETAILTLYRKLDLSPPQIRFFQGPDSLIAAPIERTSQEIWRSKIERLIQGMSTATGLIIFVVGIGLLNNPKFYTVFPVANQLVPLCSWSLVPSILMFGLLEDSQSTNKWVARLGRYSSILKQVNTILALGLIALFTCFFMVGPLILCLLYPDVFLDGWTISHAISVVSFIIFCVSALIGLPPSIQSRHHALILKEVFQYDRQRPRNSSVSAPNTQASSSRSSDSKVPINLDYISTLRWVYLLKTGSGKNEAILFNEYWLAVDQINDHAWIDFCIEELGCDYDGDLWNASRVLMQECGLLLPLTKACYVCDRPLKIQINEDNQLHAIASPAIRKKK